jgi:hypothetical protein
MVALNVCAVTSSFEDGEKRKPDRIVKVYILPPSVGVGTASATSGTICDPAVPWGSEEPAASCPVGTGRWRCTVPSGCAARQGNNPRRLLPANP